MSKRDIYWDRGLRILTASIVAPSKQTGKDAPTFGVKLVFRAAAVQMPDISICRIRSRARSSFGDITPNPKKAQ